MHFDDQIWKEHLSLKQHIQSILSIGRLIDSSAMLNCRRGCFNWRDSFNCHQGSTWKYGSYIGAALSYKWLSSSSPLYYTFFDLLLEGTHPLSCFILLPVGNLCGQVRKRHPWGDAKATKVQNSAIDKALAYLGCINFSLTSSYFAHTGGDREKACRDIGSKDGSWQCKTSKNKERKTSKTWGWCAEVEPLGLIK